MDTFKCGRRHESGSVCGALNLADAAFCHFCRATDADGLRDEVPTPRKTKKTAAKKTAAKKKTKR